MKWQHDMVAGGPDRSLASQALCAQGRALLVATTDQLRRHQAETRQRAARQAGGNSAPIPSSYML